MYKIKTPITTPPIVSISRTQTSVDLLKYTHSYLLRKAAPQTEEQWANDMFNRGMQFSILFARLFATNKQNFIEELLIKSPAQDKHPNNIFWMWWRIKYMQDDYDYVHNKLYNLQGNMYAIFKDMMLGNEQLEIELLNMLNDNKII